MVRGGEKLEAFLRGQDQNLQPGTVRVGFLAGATYPDGTTVATVAAIQNFGAPAAGIPPRPFFSNMITTKSPEWPALVAAAMKATDNDVHAALAMVGEHIAGDLRQAIVDFDSVPLKPATIKAKGFEKQLVDTGHMLGSVDSEVIPGVDH